MRCIYKNLQKETPAFAIEINDTSFFIGDATQKEVFELDHKKAFNSLISLFSLKEEWKSYDIEDPSCEIYFEKDGEEEVYRFGNNLPSNWFLFQAVLQRLVGDNL